MTQGRVVFEWHDRDVINRVGAQVADNMETACVLVERDMVRRAPRWTGLTQESVIHEVVAYDDVIEGRVGLKLKGQRRKPWYWVFIELGTRLIKAAPFIRPSLFENAREILQAIQGRKG